jgi:hypothetical protein
MASAGSGWTIQSTYAPPVVGKQDTALDAISCSASNACMAIGHAGSADFIYETWNGTTWSPHLKANPPNGAVGGVSCSSASACTLMAGSQNRQLALRWNGTSWQTQTVPAPPSAGLAGVSCPRTLFCMAVGGGGSIPHGTTTAGKWDGTAWSIVPTPSTGQPFAVLTDVSCLTPSDCVAIGEDGNVETSHLVPLIEAWNGTSWTIQQTPPVSSSTGPQLDSVSCATADSCTAIGTYSTSAGEEPLVEHWDGTTWALQAIPHATNATLTSVSCPSATSCTAAGVRFTSSGPLVTVAAHWNGTTWALQNPPNPKGATRSQFDGVSCPTTTVCEAAGMIHVNATGLRFRDKTLIEGN